MSDLSDRTLADQTPAEPIAVRVALDRGAAREFFRLPTSPLRVEATAAGSFGGTSWRELTFEVRPGLRSTATVVDPGHHEGPGVLMAHGGNDDGRHFFLPEARALAAKGATVILPATHFPRHFDADEVAAAVRDAVLTERRALDVLRDWVGLRSPRPCFLGHSGGGALGSILSAVEPRLSRIAVFGYGAGTFSRLARADLRAGGRSMSARMSAAIDWLDPGHYPVVPGDRIFFVQHGRDDEVVPIAEGRALFEAAAAEKKWAEYACGHASDADPQAQADRADLVFAS